MKQSHAHIKLIARLAVLCLALVWCVPAFAADAVKIKELENKAQWFYDLREDMASANSAIDTYRQILELDPNHAQAPLRLANLYIWVGFHQGEDVTIYDKAVEVSKMAVERHPELPGPRYWLGVAYGLKATAPETGPLTCLSLIEPIEAQMNKLIDLDPAYEHGGPWRVLGRLNTKTPFLLGGDKELAEEYLRKALKQGPQYYLNHLYLADLLGRLGRRDEAVKLVKQVLDGPPLPGLEPETKLWKDTARDVLTQQAKLNGQSTGPISH